MRCPECKLVELFVVKVNGDVIHYKCKKCGKEIKRLQGDSK